MKAMNQRIAVTIALGVAWCVSGVNSQAALVAKWSLNEAASGDVTAGQILDTGANAFNSSCLGVYGSGTPTWTTWVGPSYANSDGIAVSLNTGNLYFDKGASDELIITGDLSVFLRIQYQDGAGYDSFTGRRGSSTDGSTDNSWELYTDPSHQLRFDVHNGTTTIYGVGPVLTSGEYYDIVAVFDSTAQETKLYTNGVLALTVATGFSSLNAAPTIPLFLGYGGAGLTGAPAGTVLEQARIYNSALSAGDAAALSALTLAPPAASSADPAIQIGWASVTTSQYQVQSSTNLSSGPWVNVGPVIPGNGTTNYWSDPTGSNTNKFYRVQTLP